MTWQAAARILPFILAVAGLPALALYVLWRRSTPWARTAALLLLAMAEWALGRALEVTSSDLATKVLWDKLQYIGMAIMPAAWWVYTLQYTGREKWLTRRNLATLIGISAIALLLVFTNEAHGLMWSQVRLQTDVPYATLEKDHGVALWIYAAYSYALLALGASLLVQMLIYSRHLYRWQAGALLAAACLPWLASALDLFGLNPFSPLDPVPVALTLAGLIVGWGIFRLRLGAIVPVARAVVVESMSDCVIVLDARCRILDLNPVAQRLIGRDTSSAIGQPVERVFPELPEQMEHTCNGSGEGKQVMLGIGDDPRTYDVHISPLLDWRGRLIGRVVVLRDITDHKRVEEGLRKAEGEKALILDSISEIVTYQDRDLRIVWTNQAGDGTTNSTPNEPVGQHCYEAWQQRDRPCEECPVIEALNTGQPHEAQVVTPDQRTWSIRAYPVRGECGEIVGAVEVALDTTEREKLERQFLQAQRMEAVGRLAGGVAHDFNNLLTAIMGYTSLLLSESDLAESTRADLQEIQQAANRAASLTRQLLAFSRKQILQPRTLDLNLVVSDLTKMIRRLVGEDIELITDLDPALGFIRADPGQIEQLIVNLIVNACDAMPHGGKLILKTANVELDQTCDHGQADVEPGSYVMLAVSDTGVGMDRETLSRLFEPFFTTKEGGKGTGLGLSTVYGIVRQHGGTIWPTSEPGQGATFKICLPRVDQEVDAQEANAAFAELLRGTETILLAEDEDGVRAVTRTALQRYGYTVLEARNGPEAISICQRHEGPVHLLLTDVVMPGMSGRELAESLSPFRPETKVLYMSGHTDDAIVRHGVLDASVPFLQKPFAVGVLIYKVREVLENQSEN